MRAVRVLVGFVVLGAATPPLLLASLIWNWDVQGGLSLLPIFVAYVPFGVVAPLACLAGSSFRALAAPERALLRRGGFGALVLCAASTGWALTLTTPSQRGEPSGTYGFGIPYKTRRPLDR